MSQGIDHRHEEMEIEATEKSIALLNEIIDEEIEEEVGELLYCREWIRYMVDVNFEEVLGPRRFTLSELVDIDSPLCDFGFADVCEHYLRDTKVGEIVYIPAEESDDGDLVYLLKRIK